MKKSSIITILCLIWTLSVRPSSSCTNDTRCADCNSYLIVIGFSVFLYYNCDQCITNSALNPQTNLCECLQGFYQNGNSSCVKCPSLCPTCTGQNTCTSCYADQKRTLSGGACVCMDGYQSKNNQVVCKEKPNVLMIVLSTIGSAVCMVLGFIVCAFIRMRRGSQQIHAQTRKRNQSVNAQIQIHCSNFDPNQNSSNTFWNSKSIPYKQQQLCSICLDSNPLFMTECGHYFHAKCIYGWLSTKTTCPNCNKETQQKNVRRWCEKCKKVLMPVVMNITIKRPSAKKKREIIQSSPVELQICDNCQGESISQEGGFHTIEKPTLADHNFSNENEI